MKPALVTSLGLTFLYFGLRAEAQPRTASKCPDLVDVLTHRYSNYRTGANLCEPQLTQNRVSPGSFGKLFTLPVQGQVYAQPLIVTQVSVYNNFTHHMEEKRNLVVIATMENWVYAYDAGGKNQDPDGVPHPYWKLQLGPPLPVDRIPHDAGGALGKFNISPLVGITSTPVVDPKKQTLFVVAKIAKIKPDQVDCDQQPATSDCPVDNVIASINLVDGSYKKVPIYLPPPTTQQIGHRCELDPRTIQPGDAARINLQRAALLYTNDGAAGHIYLSFGSHQDAPCPMYHGMVVRFDWNGSTLVQYTKRNFVTTDPNDVDSFPHLDPKRLGKGGVWQAGNGPAADNSGNLYIMTGNGGFEAGKQYSSSFVKLDPDLNVVDWFAPSNVEFLNKDVFDVDLGSSGPVLIPGSDELVGGGKQGKLYVLKQSTLGHLQPKHSVAPAIQDFWAAERWSPSLFHRLPISLILPLFATGYHHIHGAPAFWADPHESDPDTILQRSLYVWPERDHLKAFRYTRLATADRYGRLSADNPVLGPKDGLGMPGGFLSISSNPANPDTGLLWAALPMHEDAWVDIVRGALRVFRISRDGAMVDTLWTSYCADQSDRFDFAKYVPPVVANGKVYLATFSGFVSVYGPFPNGQTRTPSVPDQNCQPPSEAMPSYRMNYPKH